MTRLAFDKFRSLYIPIYIYRYLLSGYFALHHGDTDYVVSSKNHTWA